MVDRQPRGFFFRIAKKYMDYQLWTIDHGLIMDITVEELKRKLDAGEEFIFIDVREVHEYQESNLKPQRKINSFRSVTLPSS